MEEFFINDGGIKLHAKLDLPEGVQTCPLAIVLHGLTGHMEEPHITGIAKALNSAGFATLRTEMYGHGGSDGAFRDHTLLKWASNALAVVDYAKSLDFVTDQYLCGHSQGGLLTILTAALRPDDFKAIAPLSPALCIVSGAKVGNLFGLVEFDPKHVPDVVDLGMAQLSGDYVRVAQLIDLDTVISRHEEPTLIVHGDADELVPYADSIAAIQKYENGTLATIPGDTHNYFNHLDMVKEAVVDFFSSLR